METWGKGDSAVEGGVAACRMLLPRDRGCTTPPSRPATLEAVLVSTLTTATSWTAAGAEHVKPRSIDSAAGTAVCVSGAFSAAVEDTQGSFRVASTALASTQAVAMSGETLAFGAKIVVNECVVGSSVPTWPLPAHTGTESSCVAMVGKEMALWFPATSDALVVGRGVMKGGIKGSAAPLASDACKSKRVAFAMAASLDLKGAVAALRMVLLGAEAPVLSFTAASAALMLVVEVGSGLLVGEPEAEAAGFVAGMKGVAVAVIVTGAACDATGRSIWMAAA